MRSISLVLGTCSQNLLAKAMEESLPQDFALSPDTQLSRVMNIFVKVLMRCPLKTIIVGTHRKLQKGLISDLSGNSEPVT